LSIRALIQRFKIPNDYQSERAAENESTNSGAIQPESNEGSEMGNPIPDSVSVERERQALNALLDQMVRELPVNQYSDSCILEAAKIAPLTSKDSYKSLIKTLSSMILSGTADGKSIDQVPAIGYANTLRYADQYRGVKIQDEQLKQIGNAEQNLNGDVKKPENEEVVKDDLDEALQTGPVMQNLLIKLQAAQTRGAGAQEIYSLVWILLNVLDSMVDSQANGLDTEKIRDPLLEILDDLSDHDEIRLAQISSFIIQSPSSYS
jgi:hypothetical protein